MCFIYAFETDLEDDNDVTVRPGNLPIGPDFQTPKPSSYESDDSTFHPTPDSSRENRYQNFSNKGSKQVMTYDGSDKHGTIMCDVTITL